MSVIIPNRNGGERLLLCLASVVNTLPAGAEIILVDDDSQDGSPEAVEAAFPQVKVLRQENHFGAAAARNRGLQAAVGEFLLCVDADVQCGHGCLSALLGTLEEHDIAFPTLIAEDGQLLNPRDAFSQRCCLNSAVFGIHRMALERIEPWFDEIIEIYGEDNDFFLRADRLGMRFRYVEEAQAFHPSPRLMGERHFYLTVRNAVYVWLKLRWLVDYWMPMDIWIMTFLASHLAGALINRSLAYPHIQYTDGPRRHLLARFQQALTWNIHHRHHTLTQRRAFEKALQHENPDL